jgi:enoyl-[acyl-carrier-protein] reductase (NADH)
MAITEPLRNPLSRYDVMGMALYLLAPAANVCTGQVMVMDGGFTAG